MASGLTHIMITQKLLENLTEGKVKNYLSSNQEFIFLGSVGPDLPYLSILDNDFFDNEEFLADYFHYQHTNEIVLNGLDEIKSDSSPLEVRVAKFAFILGYASHIIVDGIVHPFVRDMVGDYQLAPSKHRRLEMGLDVLLMEKLFNLNLNNTDYQNQLNWCLESENLDDVISFFNKQIHHVYGQLPDMVKEKDDVYPSKIKGWIKALVLSLEVAESDNYPLFYKKLMFKKGLAFPDISQIENEKDSFLILDKPVDALEKSLKDNFLQEKKNLNFLTDVYPKCLSELEKFWNSAFTYVFDDGDKPLFPAINLDNGRLLENDVLDEIPYYWRS